MRKIYLAILMALFWGQLLQAQQQPMFTHYMYNTLWFNPAYAGTRGMLSIVGLHRSQWVGFDKAPVDQSLTLHTPIFNGNMGLGLSVVNDKIGPTQMTSVALDLAYHVRLTQRSQLSFGLNGGVNIYNNRLRSLKLDNPADIAFAENYNNTLSNVGAGIYYHRERFYAGFSTPGLMENKLNGSLSADSKEQRHYYFILGTVFDLSKVMKLKPTCLLKGTAGAPIQGNITAEFIFYERFSLGAMYRTGDAAGLLLGLYLNEQFAIGYSFDWSMANTTGRFNSGSHEIMLRYELISKNKAKIKSTCYF